MKLLNSFTLCIVLTGSVLCMPARAQKEQANQPHAPLKGVINSIFCNRMIPMSAFINISPAGEGEQITVAGTDGVTRVMARQGEDELPSSLYALKKGQTVEIDVDELKGTTSVKSASTVWILSPIETGAGESVRPSRPVMGTVSSISPEEKRKSIERVKSLLREKSYDRALAIVRRLASQKRNDLEICYAQAVLLREIENRDGRRHHASKNCFKTASLFQPESGREYWMRAQCFDALGDRAAKRADLRTAKKKGFKYEASMGPVP